MIFVANVTITKQISLQFNCNGVLSIAKEVTVLIKTIPHQSLAYETTHTVNISRTNLTNCQNIQLFDDNYVKLTNQKYNIKVSWSLLWSSVPIECDMGNYSVPLNQTTSGSTTLVVEIVVPIVCAIIVIILIIIIVYVAIKLYKRHKNQSCQSTREYQPLKGKDSAYSESS